MTTESVISEADRAIIKAYKSGEPDAFRTVDRWISIVVHSNHWGLQDYREDILQEVRRRLYQNLIQDRFRGGSALKTYVVQISKYVCIEYLRRKIRQQAGSLESVSLMDPEPNPLKKLEISEKAEIVNQAISQLPPHCRELFELIFHQELPYSEISERLGVAEGTVKSRAWRCRDNLFKCLKNMGLKC